MKVLLGFLIFGLSAAPVRVQNFDNAPLGKTPPGWTVPANHTHSPKWEVLRDRSAPTPPYVLAQTGANRDEEGFPLAIFNEVSLRDGEVSVKMKPLSGHDTQAGGIVWRYRDENNYYVARANAVNHHIQVFKVENGRQTPLLAAVRHEVPANSWSILKVWVRGNRFQVYMDHRRILQGTDNTFTGPGRAGLLTVGDSVTYFDEFRVAPR